MENYTLLLENARKNCKIADNMAYVSLSLLKENKLIIKVIEELTKSAENLVKAYLLYEARLQRVKLSKNPEQNIEIFRKTSLRYIDKSQAEDLLKLLELQKKHKESDFEFMRNNKFVIMSKNKYETVEIDTVKRLINSVKRSISNFPGERKI